MASQKIAVSSDRDSSLLLGVFQREPVAGGFVIIWPIFDNSDGLIYRRFIICFIKG